MNCWKENPQDRPSFLELKDIMEEIIQTSSCSTSFQLEVTTNSQYYSMETDDSSDEDDTSDGRSSSDANNNDLQDTVNDIDDTNRISCLDDVFQPDEDDSDTDQEDSDGGATSNGKSPKKKAKVKKKKTKTEIKAPRPKKLDSLRDSTCSHDELLPPSLCSPEMKTNVCFECEL